jgi:hypothetical protein
MTFRAEVLLNGKTATGIAVPDEVVSGLASGKRPPVQVTIGDYTYRTTVASRGQRFLIPISAENRTGAGVAAGQEIEVDVALDTAPRVVTVPSDLADALEREPEALRFFEGLSYSRQRFFVDSVEGAKTDATRVRRIDKAIGMLREGRTR